jgi:hypothetical protein
MLNVLREEIEIKGENVTAIKVVGVFFFYMFRSKLYKTENNP